MLILYESAGRSPASEPIPEGGDRQLYAFAIDRATTAPVNRKPTHIAVPANHGLDVAGGATLDVTARTVPFWGRLNWA